MTAQHTNKPEDQHPTEDKTDPIGPISLPKRLRIGARAFALVGAASALAVGVIEVTDGCSTITTIGNPH